MLSEFNQWFRKNARIEANDLDSSFDSFFHTFFSFCGTDHNLNLLFVLVCLISNKTVALSHRYDFLTHKYISNIA